MLVQRFDVRIAAGPRGHALIVVPFDPDAEWGVKADPAAGAFFDTLAQFYRKGYLRYIDATKRRPERKAAVMR